MYRRGLFCCGPYLSRGHLGYSRQPGEGSLSIIMCLNLYVHMYMMVQKCRTIWKSLQVCFLTTYMHVYMISWWLLSIPFKWWFSWMEMIFVKTIFSRNFDNDYDGFMNSKCFTIKNTCLSMFWTSCTCMAS